MTCFGGNNKIVRYLDRQFPLVITLVHNSFQMKRDIGLAAYCQTSIAVIHFRFNFIIDRNVVIHYLL
jgi:hypothetical protein